MPVTSLCERISGPKKPMVDGMGAKALATQFTIDCEDRAACPNAEANTVDSLYFPR